MEPRKSLFTREHDVLRALLRTYRTTARLTQAAVAAALGRPQSFVSKYESGERRLDVIELRSICAVLGTDLPAFVAAFERALGR